MAELSAFFRLELHHVVDGEQRSRPCLFRRLECQNIHTILDSEAGNLQRNQGITQRSQKIKHHQP